jgi:hypothetical protein
MAVESIAERTIQAEQQAKLVRADPVIRAVEMHASGGTVTKDPVYEALSGASGFRSLLHARSLYSLGRSLCVDDPALYAAAVKLYETRNSIAHGESRSDSDKVFRKSPEGATEALVTAVGVVEWFGDPGPYCVWHSFGNPITGTMMGPVFERDS